MRTEIVLIPFVLLAASLMLADSVMACSCGSPPSVEDALNQSSVVFVGTVVGGSLEGEPGFEFSRVDFLVEGVWKGPVTREYAIATPPHGAICGIYFEVGQEYVVYAGGLIWDYDTDLFMAGLCGRTKLSEVAAVDFNELGPYTPLPVTAMTWGLLKARYEAPEYTLNR